MENNIVLQLKPTIEKIVTDQGLKLFDLEYVKEDGTYFLRVSIEKQDGTMDFETAEIISDLVSKKLDELDPIDHEYILDVCSPGAERPIKTKEDYTSNLNNYVSIYTKDITYTGYILEVNEKGILLSYNEKGRIKKINIDFDNIIKAHTAIKF